MKSQENQASNGYDVGNQASAINPTTKNSESRNLQTTRPQEPIRFSSHHDNWRTAPSFQRVECITQIPTFHRTQETRISYERDSLTVMMDEFLADFEDPNELMDTESTWPVEDHGDLRPFLTNDVKPQ